MVELIQSLQASIDIVGKLRALSKKVEDADFKMLLADLSSELGDAKLEVANLKSEVAELKTLNAQQAALLAQRSAGKPTISEGVYRFSDDDGHFCTACFDVKDKRVRVTLLSGPFADFGKWECPSCKAVYGESRLDFPSA